MDPLTLTLALTAIAIPVALAAWHVGRGIAEGIKEHRRHH